MHLAQRQVVEVHHWAAAETAAGTDGESCYEVSTDP